MSLLQDSQTKILVTYIKIKARHPVFQGHLRVTLGSCSGRLDARLEKITRTSAFACAGSNGIDNEATCILITFATIVRSITTTEI